MEAIINKIQFINNAIAIQEEELNVIAKSSFYSIYGNEDMRRADMKKSRNEKKDLLKRKYSLLESLQLEINKELNNVSLQERENTLRTA